MHQTVLQQLQQLETFLKDHQLWQQQPQPAQAAFASTSPFCCDSMSPLQWLRFVFIPRLRQCCVEQQPLPRTSAISEYFELVLMGDDDVKSPLLHQLNALDRLLNGQV